MTTSVSLGAVGSTRGGVGNGPPAIPAMPLGSIEGMMQAALSLRISGQNDTAKSQQSRAKFAAEERQASLDESFRALKDAEAAEASAKQSHGIFDTLKIVAGCIGIAASIAGMAATGGASIAGVLACAGAVLSLCSDKIGEATHNKDLALAASIGGAALSLSGGVASIFTSSAVVDIANKGLEVGYKIAESATNATAAGFEYDSRIKSSQAMDSRADSTALEAHATSEQRQVADVIELLREIEKARSRALKGTASASSEMHEVEKSIAMKIGRV